MQTQLVCSLCCVEAPTRPATFRHNVGAIVLRFDFTSEGNLCKRCVHRCFWRHTGANLILGWWGFFSMVITPVYVLLNVGNYIACLGMPRVPAGARVPELNAGEALRLVPLEAEIVRAAEAGIPRDDLSRALADRVDLSPGQVYAYIGWLEQTGRYHELKYAPYRENPDPGQAPW